MHEASAPVWDRLEALRLEIIPPAVIAKHKGQTGCSYFFFRHAGQRSSGKRTQIGAPLSLLWV
eukprot:12918515-Prorocentrum_lima.AAC.1